MVRLRGVLLVGIFEREKTSTGKKKSKLGKRSPIFFFQNISTVTREGFFLFFGSWLRGGIFPSDSSDQVHQHWSRRLCFFFFFLKYLNWKHWAVRTPLFSFSYIFFSNGKVFDQSEISTWLVVKLSTKWKAIRTKNSLQKNPLQGSMPSSLHLVCLVSEVPYSGSHCL